MLFFLIVNLLFFSNRIDLFTMLTNQFIIRNISNVIKKINKTINSELNFQLIYYFIQYIRIKIMNKILNIENKNPIKRPKLLIFSFSLTKITNIIPFNL